MRLPAFISIGLLVLLVCFCVFLLLPLESYWPGSLPYAAVSGRLDGKPVEVSLDRTSSDAPTVEVRIEFSMRSGTFRAAYPEMGARSYLVGGQEGDYRLRLPREKALLLDPMGGRGEYELTIGTPYHPLSRPARRMVALCILVGLALGLSARLLARRSSRVLALLKGLDTRIRSIGRARIAVGAAIGLASVLLYSVVHELGHYLGAVASGIPVDHVAWSLFSGESPHVRYAVSPTGWPDAVADAGGTLLPTLVAWALLGAWLTLRRRMRVHLQMLLAIPAVAFLFSNVSGIIDAVNFVAGDRPGHMTTLGVQLGLGAPGAVLFALVPTALTVLAYLVVFRSLRKRPAGRD